MRHDPVSNIYYLYVIKFTKWFMLFMPYIVPFYEQNGLGMRDIMTLRAIYSVAIVVMEIPSGYLADIIGRKKALLFGALLGFAGMGTYAFSYSFWSFMIAEIILGIGYSMISGADSAMLYDSLLSVNRQSDYVKYEGRLVALGNISEAVAAILGGFIAAISLRTNYYFQTGIAFLAIPFALLLVEPARHKTVVLQGFRGIIRVVRHSLIEHPTLRRNIFYSSLTGTSTLTLAWFAQPYFEHVGLPLDLFGIMWMLLNATVGVMAFLAFRIEKRISPRAMIPAITLFISAGYLLTSVTEALWGIAFLFMFYAVRGIATPVLKDYINRDAASENRATVLSVRNFIIRIMFIVIGPVMGAITDGAGLPTALLSGGLFFLFFGMFTGSLYVRSLIRRRKKD